LHILAQVEHSSWRNLNTDSGFKLNTFLDFPESVQNGVQNFPG